MATREIFIYDEIGPDWMGFVSAKSIVEQLAAAKNDPVTVRINSPGGDVFEGIAIHTALRNHKPGVTVQVDSLAASAASFIAMAGSKIEIAESGMMMIHNALAFTFGNKATHATVLDLLGKVDDTLVGIYHARTNVPIADIRGMMDLETWITAEEAIKYGFADSIGTTNGVKPAAIKAGRYQHTPAALVAQELPRELQRKAIESYYASKIRLTRSSQSA